MKINDVPPGHRVRTTDHLSPASDDQVDKWRALGKAVLAFHHRVAMTAVCRCGRTIVGCDVLDNARKLGLLPPLE